MHKLAKLVSALSKQTLLIRVSSFYKTNLGIVQVKIDDASILRQIPGIRIYKGLNLKLAGDSGVSAVKSPCKYVFGTGRHNSKTQCSIRNIVPTIFHSCWQGIHDYYANFHKHPILRSQVRFLFTCLEIPLSRSSDFSQEPRSRLPLAVR